MVANLHILPNEILLQVAKYLDPKQTLRFAVTSRQINSISNLLLKESVLNSKSGWKESILNDRNSWAVQILKTPGSKCNIQAAIDLAVESDNHHFLNLLFEDDGVDLTLVKHYPIRYACTIGFLALVDFLLQVSSANGHLEVVDRLLQDARFILNHLLSLGKKLTDIFTLSSSPYTLTPHSL